MNRFPVHLLLMVLVVIMLTATRLLWMDTKLEYLLVIGGIFITGIPHGAMDHLTASYLHGPRFPLIRYILFYLLAAFLYLSVWYFFPGIAFLFFLFFTAWHFGETDLQCFGKQKAAGLRVFAYGWCLLMWLLLGDAGTILQWTDLITGAQPLAHASIKMLSSIPPLLWFVAAAVLLLVGVYKDRQRLAEALLFLFFVWMAAHTSLLLGFVIYFAGWHSLRALLHLRNSVFKRFGLLKMIWKAVPALAGTLLLLVIIFSLGDGGWLENNGLPSLFILLAVLTLPHMAQMHLLYQFLSADGKMVD